MALFDKKKDPSTQGVPKKELFTKGAVTFVGILPGVALALALGATVFAGVELNRVARDKTTAIKYVLDKQPVALADAAKISAKLGQLNPLLAVKAESGVLTITSKNSANYSEFLYALSVLPGIEKDVAWEMKSVCLNDCPNQVAIEATLNGYRQKIRTEGDASAAIPALPKI